MKGTIATISSFLCVLLSAAQTEAVVAPVKMNVLYIGVENPLCIAVPGVASKDVSATISENAVLEKVSDGHFIAKPMSVGKCVVTVYAKGKPVSSTDYGFAFSVNGNNAFTYRHGFCDKMSIAHFF